MSDTHSGTSDAPNQDFLEVLDPPFDHPNADIIARSATSRVDFPVVKAFLAFASPLWNDMLLGPLAKGAQNEMKANRPVIAFQEDKDTLETLLRCCYPPTYGPNTKAFLIFTDLATAANVFEAARKHCAEGVERWVLDQVMSTLLDTKPLSLFAFLWRFEMKEEVRMVARRTLSTPFLQREYVKELEWITGGAYHRLKDYHTRCGEVAAALTTDMRWFSGGGTWFSCLRCSDPNNTFRTFMLSGGRQLSVHSRWWREFHAQLTESLRERPCRTTVENREQIDDAVAKASTCLGCRDRALNDLKVFSKALAVEVEKAVDKVELEIPF